MRLEALTDRAIVHWSGGHEALQGVDIMMQHWNIGLWAASFLLATSAGATPADTEAESLDEVPQVGSRFELRSHPQSEKLDVSIHATIEENGSHIDTVGTFRIGDPALYYHLEIDLKARSYKATRREIPSGWLKVPSRKSGANSTTLAITPGSWYAEAKLITEDPPQIDLATTTNYVSWTVAADGSMTINSANGTCLPYDGTGQPYPTDTHWFISSCTRSITSPWAQQVDGSYYNWDWGWDDEVTVAAHALKIQPNNDASFTYWNGYSHQGEDNWLLQADLFVNGVQQY